MQYQVARSELQSPPKRVDLTPLFIEAVVMVLIAAALLWFV